MINTATKDILIETFTVRVLQDFTYTEVNHANRIVTTNILKNNKLNVELRGSQLVPSGLYSTFDYFGTRCSFTGDIRETLNKHVTTKIEDITAKNR